MNRQTRRDFIRTAAMTGAGVLAVESSWAQSKSPNEKVNFACIGVGGKGGDDTNNFGRLANIVAICDVDDNTLNFVGDRRFPKAKRYNDYRKMLDEMSKEIDAVTVSTPDHTHAPAASMAMHLGKHVFCQKPLAHSIYEARYLGNLAKKMKVYTQMGNQGTGNNDMRKNAYRVRAGVLGKVSEVHVWTNRPIWPQGQKRNPPKEAPSNLHWDLWLGSAPERPYADGYHTFAWRGYWDFGTGALGDMACHTVNLPYMALDLRYPTSVVAESSENNKDSYPSSSKITFQFPATKSRGPITLYWYDGHNLPSKDLLPGMEFSDSGSLIIGDKGKLYTPGDYGDGGKFIGVEPGEVEYPHSPGHNEELIRAIKEGIPATSNFPDYSGPLTETILLGNLAVWAAGTKLDWDAKNLKVKNTREVDHIVKPQFRKSFGLS